MKSKLLGIKGAARRLEKKTSLLSSCFLQPGIHDTNAHVGNKLGRFLFILRRLQGNACSAEALALPCVQREELIDGVNS